VRQLNHTKLVVLIRGARAASNPADVARLGEEAITASLSPKMRLSIAKELVAAGRGDLAWKALSADPATFTHPTFPLNSRRILTAVRDRQLREEIQAARSAAMNGGQAIKAEPLDIPFSAKPAKRGKLGNISLVAVATVEQRHVDRFHQEMQIFRRRLRVDHTPKLVEYTNVFLDRNGQVWKENGAIVRSSGAPIATTDTSSVPNIDTAFFAVSATSGIYHWLVDQLPGFSWMFVRGNSAPKILLSDEAPRFKKETLELCRLAHKIVAVGDAVYVSHLIMADVGFRGIAKWKAVEPIFRKIAANATSRFGTKIYISRRSAKRRQMTNEAEVEALMSRLGFDIIRMEELTLKEQVGIASHAEVIAGPHGAGLAHIMFAPKSCRVIEIMPIIEGAYFLRFNYARLCLTRGLTYRALMVDQPFGTQQRWNVDLQELETFMLQALEPQSMSEKRAEA